MTTPLPDLPRPTELDIAPVTVLALAWLAGIVATSMTLWILVAVIGT